MPADRPEIGLVGVCVGVRGDVPSPARRRWRPARASGSGPVEVRARRPVAIPRAALACPATGASSANAAAIPKTQGGGVHGRTGTSANAEVPLDETLAERVGADAVPKWTHPCQHDPEVTRSVRREMKVPNDRVAFTRHPGY